MSSIGSFLFPLLTMRCFVIEEQPAFFSECQSRRSMRPWRSNERPSWRWMSSSTSEGESFFPSAAIVIQPSVRWAASARAKPFKARNSSPCWEATAGAGFQPNWRWKNLSKVCSSQLQKTDSFFLPAMMSPHWKLLRCDALARQIEMASFHLEFPKLLAALKHAEDKKAAEILNKFWVPWHSNVRWVVNQSDVHETKSDGSAR